ncbi:MAG TPA: hypothetical protein VD811_07585 [Desulfuromonadales bacterium]|nr:hypothetical protein [Desulfuromonadales bacterium]
MADIDAVVKLRLAVAIAGPACVQGGERSMSVRMAMPCENSGGRIVFAAVGTTLEF